VAFERACQPWAKRIVVLDDFVTRDHAADILLNSATVTMDQYRNRVARACKLLLGPKYALVHPQFRISRTRALKSPRESRLQRVLVSFGQGDTANAVASALASLVTVHFDGIVTVVLGRGMSQSSFERLAPARTTFCVDVKNMASLMAGCNLAIGAGGVSAWERCCLGLPSILVTLAQNQRGVIETIVDAGAGIDAGADGPGLEQRVTRILRQLLGGEHSMQTMSEAGVALIDGRGGDRLLLACVGSIPNRDHKPVELRLAELKDEAWLLALQSEPQTRRYANDPSVPSSESHGRWFKQTLLNPERTLMIIELERKPVGMLRMDHGILADRVSIAVAPDYHGRGIGAASLGLAMRMSPGRCLEAEILPENHASLAMFARSGFLKVGEMLFRREPR
jgi:spore coat polysaccharide biosynthesis predicted glycosyltransferase SpsG/RimJ/RimL family protein N-acetyltransferase